VQRAWKAEYQTQTPSQTTCLICIRACARNPPNTPSHGGAATVTGCLCDGNSRGKQPGADCQRTGGPQDQRVWHFDAAEPAAGRRGRTARKGEGAWHFGAAQWRAGCRRADGPIEPATHTSSQISVCLCAGIRSIFTNEARKHTNHNSRDYFLWSLTPELTGAGGPIGPQGTNIGHQNREAMANVGVRVERFVRLGRVGRGWQVHSKFVRFECPPSSS
jgi:hypothetical protein